MASHRWMNLVDAARAALSSTLRSAPGASTADRDASARGRRPGVPASRTAVGTYVGDYTGVVDAVYAPQPDGDPDPGEIVWTWIPYEDDHTRGKDRPALLVGRDGPWLLALPLTSKDHDRDASQEARHGRVWMDIGTGPWDGRGRPSEVRVDRVVRVSPAAVRREGAVLDRRTFEQVVAAMTRVRR